MTTPTGIPQYDATLPQGQAVHFEITWHDADDNPIDTTGKVLRMAADKNGTRVLLIERGVSSPDGEITADDPNGVITVTVNGSETQTWEGTIAYAIVSDPGTANAVVLAEGDFFMIKTVNAS